MPNSRMRDVAPCDGRVGGQCNPAQGDPDQACYDSYAIQDISHIMNGWNGGAFDTHRNRLLIFGGGLTMMLGSPVPVLLIMIALKIFFDIKAHLKQHSGGKHENSAAA